MPGLEILETINTNIASIAADTSAPNAKLVSAALDHASFTDNGDATCKINTGLTVPLGCVVEAIKVKWTEAPNVAGSAGETTITCTLGDATGGDVDRLGAALAQTLGATGSQYDTPVGDPVYAANTAVWLHATLSGGTPDASNFVAAGGAGVAVVTILYRNLASL